MGKRALSLYVDDELITIATSKDINLSKFFQNALEVELSVKDLEDEGKQEIVLTKLKTTNAILNDELRKAYEDREKLSKKILDLTRDLDLKDSELKFKDDKIRLLNEKIKKIKEDDGDGFIYDS